ncbi:MAG: ATP-dependent zinc metalloprotease FtsH [Nitrospirota bacterium]|nr:ATP-dependent zinc metalloprotease FtsH [Nitrospirota bacterium]
MNSRVKNLLFWMAVGLFMILLFNLFTVPSHAPEETIIFSEFMTHLERGEVSKVTMRDSQISAVLKDGTRISTYTVEYPDLVRALRENGVQIEAKPPEESPWYIAFLVTWGPFILFLGLWFFLMRQMQIGGNRALSFGKSRARMLTEEKKKITFADVAGIEEAKEEVVEIIDFLKDPQKFQKLGGRIPKGVLIVGPPGTGKTLLAKAIAGEAAVPFFSISGSDFVEMFVGVGASRVRDLFEQGKKHAPCIIFIDEIDAVGRLRGAGLGGGHDEREQTLNQLLVEMDGFDTTEGVILVAATNRPDVLDPALLRPGRFDRQVVVNRPDIRGRVEILKVHTKKVPIDTDVNLEQIARGTPGFSGADLENLVNEAALWAARLNKKVVELVDFENAKDKVMMGTERKSLVLSEEEKRTTAYHEAGHALMAKLLPGTDPVHKVTIIPRGRAMGMTMQLPIDDRHSYSQNFLYNTLSILLGGRVAEELVFKDVTTGAGNDIERATELARKMVCEWGMSAKLGPITFGKKEEEIFLGREIAQRRDISDQVALEIDHEVKRLIVESYERTKLMLTEHIHTLRALAEALLEKEVLDSLEIDQIISSGSIVKESAQVS